MIDEERDLYRIVPDGSRLNPEVLSHWYLSSPSSSLTTHPNGRPLIFHFVGLLKTKEKKGKEKRKKLPKLIIHTR